MLLLYIMFQLALPVRGGLIGGRLMTGGGRLMTDGGRLMTGGGRLGAGRDCLLTIKK